MRSFSLRLPAVAISSSRHGAPAASPPPASPGGWSAAVAHDFFVTEGGAEQCAIEFARMLPHARIHTSFFDPRIFGDRIAAERVATWPLQRLPTLRRRFRSLLPLYAAYFGRLRVDADLVISSSIAFTKAVRKPRNAFHVSYVYTPMRYAWDLDSYLGQSSYPLHARMAARAVRPVMRAWDRRTAGRPDSLIAISRTVEARIERHWGRPVDTVIYPPVPVDEIALGTQDDGFLFVAARLLAYRRIDIAVRACRDLGRELIVVGDGPERRRLQATAGPSVTFLGHVPRAQLVDLFRRCHAYLMPGVEDFGIAPVEAMAAGKPVIAFDAGGARETVVSGTTGILVGEQEAGAFADAIRQLDTMRFDPRAARERARLFDVSNFRKQWRQYLLTHGFDVSSLTP